MVGLCAVAATVMLIHRPRSVVRAKFDQYMRSRSLHRVLRAEWPVISTSGSLLPGRDSAPLIIEFADYQCPFCRATEHVLDSLRKSGTVRVVYYQFPLTFHPLANSAALAAVCADEQGRFGEIHRALMTTDAWERDTNWIAVAQRGGVRDLQTFGNCMNSSRAKLRIEADRSLAMRLGVGGTPTFFSQHDWLEGAVDAQRLMTLISAR